MRRRILMAVLALSPFVASAQEAIGLSAGQVITHSAKVVADERLVLPPGPPSTCLTIQGNDITVDFNDAYVRGDADVYHHRESFDGVGLLIDRCNNVTIKNAHFQGFRYNIRILNSTNVRLENCDVSFSRAILMLKDGAEQDVFMNLRDHNAWRGYGAGIWIEGSTNCTVEHCYGTGALIGAALIDSKGCTVHDCDFSFNGGWGVALSHCSDSVVAWNRLDFVNRLWDGGWGGDSAGLAVADDCDGNFFVGNSMTHGGDGFFLSNLNDVGPIDAKTGFLSPQGGSDNNVVAYNDASWSPNNAFEGTFSNGNVYLGNTSNYSGYGYWLGFSTNSLLLQNVINDNSRGGIAIEQGKGTKIVGNHLERNGGQAAISLWDTKGKERAPFPSELIDILGNEIADSVAAFRLTGSADVVAKDNKLVRALDSSFNYASRTPSDPIADFKATPYWAKLQSIIATKPADFKMYAQEHWPQGVQWLQPSPYSPKDFRGGLAAKRQVDSHLMELYLLEDGVKIAGPGWVTFEDTPDDPHFVRLIAKPSEGEVGAEKPVQVSLTSRDGKRKETVDGMLSTAVWNVKWYSWKGLSWDDEQEWQRMWQGKPIKVEQTARLGGDWSYRSPTEGVGSEHYALEATMKVKVPPGRYLFHSVSDDGIRVYVDDRPVIVRWNHHGAISDNAAIDLDENPHTILVQYCQDDGGAVLQLDWTLQDKPR